MSVGMCIGMYVGMCVGMCVGRHVSSQGAPTYIFRGERDSADVSCLALSTNRRVAKQPGSQLGS